MFLWTRDIDQASTIKSALCNRILPGYFQVREQISITSLKRKWRKIVIVDILWPTSHSRSSHSGTPSLVSILVAIPYVLNIAMNKNVLIFGNIFSSMNVCRRHLKDALFLWFSKCNETPKLNFIKTI